MLHGTRRQRRVAITIDDGPCPLLTPLILQVLDRYQVVANFFVVGEK
ncbi:MAG: polysaccharide deacetylase family protein, partial [Armatimonadetes bacterium]|nr:polysaccharide deacetylase family protein [Armatimonadota bacterium]